jgi:two-component system response regulator
MNNKMILLVEDNADDEALTLRALKKNNILNTVVVARDGAEALAYLFGAGNGDDGAAMDLPEVVLLDLNLPKISGHEVLQQIRSQERTRFLPVVVLTTSNEDEDKIKSYQLGANSYVRKPVAFEQFTEAIRQLGMYWLLLNEAPRRP